MSCCGTKASRPQKTLNWQSRLKARIDNYRGKELTLKLDAIGQLAEKFQTYSTVRENGLEVCEEDQFKDLIGNLGNFYIGTRIFNVVLQLSHKFEKVSRDVKIWTGDDCRGSIEYNPNRNYIVAEDYIVYMDMIYHGNDDEKD